MTSIVGIRGHLCEVACRLVLTMSCKYHDCQCHRTSVSPVNTNSFVHPSKCYALGTMSGARGHSYIFVDACNVIADQPCFPKKHILMCKDGAQFCRHKTIEHLASSWWAIAVCVSDSNMLPLPANYQKESSSRSHGGPITIYIYYIYILPLHLCSFMVPMCNDNLQPPQKITAVSQINSRTKVFVGGVVYSGASWVGGCCDGWTG